MRKAAAFEIASVIAFRIDAKTGELTLTGRFVDVPAPVCVRFAAIAK